MATKGKVDIHIGANTADFAAGAKRVTGSLNDISGQISRLPGLGGLGQVLTSPIVAASLAAAAFVRQLDQSITRIQQLRDLSIQMGGTTHDAQRLRYAAGVSGMQEGGLVQAIDSIRKAMGEAAIGKGEFQKALADLGFGPEQLSDASAMDVLTSMTQRMERGLTAAEYVAASRVAGGSARDLIAASGRGLPGALGGAVPFELSESDINAAANTASTKRKVLTVAGILLDRVMMFWLTGKITEYRTIAGAVLNAGAAANFPFAADLRDQILPDTLPLTGGSAGSPSRLSNQLFQRNESAMSLSAMRDANMAAYADLQFRGLSAVDQLSALQGTYNSGLGGLGSLSPMQQEQQITALLKLQEDILAVQEKAVKELEALNAAMTSPE